MTLERAEEIAKRYNFFLRYCNGDLLLGVETNSYFVCIYHYKDNCKDSFSIDISNRTYQESYNHISLKKPISTEQELFAALDFVGVDYKNSTPSSVNIIRRV